MVGKRGRRGGKGERLRDKLREKEGEREREKEGGGEGERWRGREDEKGKKGGWRVEDTHEGSGLGRRARAASPFSVPTCIGDLRKIARAVSR